MLAQVLVLGQTNEVANLWLNRFTSPELQQMAALAAVTLVVITWLVLRAIQAIHRGSAEVGLKRDMLDRGMSAEEIERVLAARSSKQ